MQSIFVTRNVSLQMYEKCFYRSTMKLADTLAIIEKGKCITFNSNDIISKRNSTNYSNNYMFNNFQIEI